MLKTNRTARFVNRNKAIRFIASIVSEKWKRYTLPTTNATIFSAANVQGI
ncbi:hypothetical protein VHA_002930 [Grimontia hollisae CIP 101886]|uniref:Uncharacterized protein n=1 Tax=Grimontia hollisae CIP 101886 TaxID=675812 RepID=D0IB03_GRIHO|nr:hypothetical protein VHA_002930 [Grimontia hollisae CIP 101886]